MNDHKLYTPASAAQVCQFWSTHLDALENQLSSKVWAPAATTLVLIAYPIARIVIPALLHAVVPDMVRTMINLL